MLLPLTPCPLGHARHSCPVATHSPTRRTPFLKSAGSNLLQLRLLLTLKERATPIVRSRPSSVHMDSVWFKRTLWETRITVLKNHAEAQFIIAGRREPSERSASY